MAFVHFQFFTHLPILLLLFYRMSISIKNIFERFINPFWQLCCLHNESIWQCENRGTFAFMMIDFLLYKNLVNCVPLILSVNKQIIKKQLRKISSVYSTPFKATLYVFS